MKFPHVIKRKEIIQAAILGSAAGLVGVFLFIIMLNSMTTEKTNNEDMVPVNSTVDSDDPFKEKFFATQHGVFSTFEGATDFVAGFSSLTTSAIVEVDGNFYVWSSVSPTKEGVAITVNPTSFAKSFYYTASSCSESSLKQIPSIIKSDDRSKFYFDDGNIPDDLPEDWQSVTQALSTFSNDLNVIRLHILSHYFSKNDCMKISF